MKALLCLCILAFCFSPAALALDRDQAGGAEAAGIIPGLLWAGSWEQEKNLSTRTELTLALPAPELDFRLVFTDRRKAANWDAFTGTFAEDPFRLSSLSGGVYQGQAGSRLLYGMISAPGLAARVRNPWIRGAPWADNHLPSEDADLRTETSSTARPALYLHLGTPAFELPDPEAKARPLDSGGGKSQPRTFRAFGAFSLESDGVEGTSLVFSGGKPAINSGLEWGFTKTSSLRIETYWTRGSLPARDSSTWFNFSPALPERDFALSAGSLVFTMPGFVLAADGAYSETFARGRGFYGNLGLSFGNRPWRFSLAADGAGSRYAGPSGGETGAGLRLAARLEYRGKRASLLRFDALVRSNETEAGAGGPGELAEKPNRYSLGAYYRFPQTVFGLDRISLKFSDDSRDPKKESASIDGLAGFRLWRAGADTQIKLSGRKNSAAGEDFNFESLRLHESLVWGSSLFRLSGGLGCTMAADKETLWDASLSAAIRWKRGKNSGGWFRTKLDAEKIPKNWSISLSWLARL